MPGRSDKLKTLAEEAEEYEIPYVSKSRVQQWLTNRNHFRLKYLEDIREPETQAMRRGGDIHETFEYYYNNRKQEGGGPPDSKFSDALPDDYTKWADYLVPYVKNFIAWEEARFQSADTLTEYLPVSVEEEHWRETPVDGVDIELMGLADVILPAGGVPEISSDSGVVIVDFKTGNTPKEQYRSPGIYTELEYYTLLFEQKYNVAGALAYYPRNGDTIIKEEGERDTVLTAIREIVDACDGYTGDEAFEISPGPLCQWSFDNEDSSAYYGVCSECTWAEPARNEERFRELIEEGHSDTEIAAELGCEPGESSYWRWKLDQ